MYARNTRIRRDVQAGTDEHVPTLGLRALRQRQVAITEGLWFGFKSIKLSTVLRPNMDAATIKYVPPYETAMIAGNGEILVVWTHQNISEARSAHAHIAGGLRTLHRMRTCYAHMTYSHRRDPRRRRNRRAKRTRA